MASCGHQQIACQADQPSLDYNVSFYPCLCAFLILYRASRALITSIPLPSLTLLTQVYASIVGDCAWEPNGCPITQQNFIDFVYSTLSDIGSADWPR